MKRKALGRGLSALLSDVQTPDISQRSVEDIQVDNIKANQFQPRSRFDEEELHELSESIKTHGVLQPLLVRADQETGTYQIIAGERRLRASKLAQTATVPCIVLQAEEAQMLEIALVENIQRSNLSAVEEAKAFKHLIDRFQLTQEDVASRVGKSRESITNFLRLLNLPKSILDALDQGRISAGHARAILGLGSAREMEEMANRVMEKNLSVRETEQLIRDASSKTKPKPKQKPQSGLDVHIQDLQKKLEDTFQTKIKLKVKGSKKGSIEFEFYDLDHLQSLLDRWGVSMD